jgi:hypothetical protein
MTREFHRRAERYCSELAAEAADQFEATLLHNLVHETVDGQHDREHDLLVALDLAERAPDLHDRTDSDVLADEALAAAQHLERPRDDLVDEIVARTCRDILIEGSEWTNAWDARDVHGAQGKALDWVSDHPAACERAGVLEAVEGTDWDLVGIETDA